MLGRQTSDAVTTLGSGVDGSVRRLETAYDTQGKPYLFTSYADTAGSTCQPGASVFNGLGQLIAEYQAHLRRGEHVHHAQGAVRLCRDGQRREQ